MSDSSNSQMKRKQLLDATHEDCLHIGLALHHKNGESFHKCRTCGDCFTLEKYQEPVVLTEEEKRLEAQALQRQRDYDYPMTPKAPWGLRDRQA